MKHQGFHNIIFSDHRSARWKRHLLFWLAIYIYQLVRVGIMMPALNTPADFMRFAKFSMYHPMATNMILVYVTCYFLIPRFFARKKYFLFATGLLLTVLLYESYTALLNYHDLGPSVRDAIGLSRGMLINTFRPGFIRGFGNPPLILGLFLSLKTLKNWHLEQLKTETLARENTNAELQLLKAQIHPHFLFNTLNNIYSFALSQSPMAGALVDKLSNMLNYMINECNYSLVPLSKELKLIKDYMELEKVRYGNRLDLQSEISGDEKNKFIAPLLLIPFVENCFKHGASIMRGKQWIKMIIKISDDQLEFYLSNSKPLNSDTDKNKKGIGLANVRKRLELLYPQNHFLKMESIDNSYIVQLKVSLQNVVVAVPEVENDLILQPVV